MNTNKNQFINSQNSKTSSQYSLEEPLIIDSQSSEEELIPWVDMYPYRFYLLGKSDMYSRLLVSIKSENMENLETHKFTVYTSLSEGGIFRYCVQSPTAIYYIKGKDYITETFVHMELQKAIIKNLDWIPNIRIDKCSSELNLFELYDSRIINIEPLQPLRLCPSGSALKPECLLYLAGNKNVKIIEKLHSCLKTMGCDQEANDKYLKEINNFIQHGSLFESGIIKDSFYNEILKDVDLYIDDVYNMVLEGLNKYLEKYIKIQDDDENIPKLIFSWNNQPIRDIFLYSNYYSLHINIDDKPYILYFNHYFLENRRETPTSITGGLLITNIVPIESEINQFGVYDKFISIGFLIYKPFEYPKQTNVGNVYSKEEYKFIGNYIRRLYPVNYIIYKYSDILYKNSLGPSKKLYSI